MWTQPGASVDTRHVLRDIGFANLLGLWIWRVDKMRTEAAHLGDHLTRTLSLIELSAK